MSRWPLKAGRRRRGVKLEASPEVCPDGLPRREKVTESEAEDLLIEDWERLRARGGIAHRSVEIAMRMTIRTGRYRHSACFLGCCTAGRMRPKTRDFQPMVELFSRKLSTCWFFATLTLVRSLSSFLQVRRNQLMCIFLVFQAEERSVWASPWPVRRSVQAASCSLTQRSLLRQIFRSLQVFPTVVVDRAIRKFWKFAQNKKRKRRKKRKSKNRKNLFRAWLLCFGARHKGSSRKGKLILQAWSLSSTTSVCSAAGRSIRRTSVRARPVRSDATELSSAWMSDFHAFQRNQVTSHNQACCFYFVLDPPNCTDCPCLAGGASRLWFK